MKMYIIADNTWTGGLLEKEGIFTTLEKAMNRCRELAAETLKKEREGEIIEGYRNTKNTVWIIGKNYSLVFQAREINVNE